MKAYDIAGAVLKLIGYTIWFSIYLCFGIALGIFLFKGTARADAPRVNKVVTAIMHHAKLNNIDPLLVAAVIRVESKFDQRAIGSSGEIGLLQLHPRWFADASFDVEQNIELGVRHLAWTRKHCPHNANFTWLTCYNAGVNKNPKYPHLNPYYKAVTSEYEALKKAR
jgi:soluble lytic murein transglycosylase-like protein